MVTIHPPVQLVGEPKKTKKKKGRKKDTKNSGKLAIRPDHPRRRIKIKFCMVVGLQCVVIHIKCHPNRLMGYGAVGGLKWPSPLLWPMAYTTACTVQAVIIMNFNFIHYRKQCFADLATARFVTSLWITLK